MSKRFVIGLNGGHDLADCMILDTKCSTHQVSITRFFGLRPINHHYLNFPSCIHHLDLAIRTFATNYGFNNHEAFMQETECICLSLAGAIPIATSGRLRRAFEQSFPSLKFLIVDDTWAGLAAETKESRGICAFAGYGASVSVVIENFEEDKKYKLDGWGPIIGDFGSGFELATEIFRQLGRYYDQGEKPLFYDYLNDCTINNISRRIMPPPLPEGLVGVQAWFDALRTDQPIDWHVRLASLAFYFLEFVEKNLGIDSDQKIIERIARNLVDTIEIALRNFSEELRGMPLILHGEMFDSSVYSDTVRGSINHHLDSGQLSACIIARKPTTQGALILAIKNLDFEISGFDQIPIFPKDVRQPKKNV